MMRLALRATIIGDGSSDRALVHVLHWIFAELRVSADVQYADLRILATVPSGLKERARAALKLFPADILFVHRDAEGEEPTFRYAEISNALSGEGLPYVPIVPVRMTEAWFLFDEDAIRTAAGNPNSNIVLNLPRLDRVEALPDPKAVLNAALLTASDLNVRRRSKFRTGTAFLRVAELITSYQALRKLPTFVRLETETAQIVQKIRATRA